MVLPPFEERHEELRGRVRRFVEAEIVPHVDEWERAGEFPRELFQRCAEEGFLGLKYPREYGGAGGDHLDDAIWVEELARAGASGGVSAGLNGHTSIAMPPILNFGTEEQKQRWIVPGLRGEKIGALGITEPGAGSDVASIQTRAEPIEGGYRVNGAKTFITNGVRADFLVCAVKSRPEGGHGGISFLILERDMPGYEVSRKLDKLGWRSSDTAELSFTDVEVPAENLLGPEHEGFKLIMANFAWERLVMSVGAVGAMDRLVEEVAGALAGSASQAQRHRLAEMALRAETGRALTYQALRLFHTGQDCLREVAMSKLFTQRALVDSAEDALQLLGLGAHTWRPAAAPGAAAADPSRALLPPGAIARALRDARLGPIGGGTDEIMREILSRTSGL